METTTCEEVEVRNEITKDRSKYLQISRLLLDRRAAEPIDEVHNILVEMGIFSSMKNHDPGSE